MDLLVWSVFNACTYIDKNELEEAIPINTLNYLRRKESFSTYYLNRTQCNKELYVRDNLVKNTERMKNNTTEIWFAYWTD